MEIIDLTNSKRNLAVKNAVQVLQRGGLIVYPTETCYGVGVDATNQDAVNKLLKYKSRREGKPLSVAVADKEMAAKYVQINDVAMNLYKHHLPGPITVVSKSLGNVAQGVASEYGTLGIRIPDHDLILDIVQQFGKPVTSTSANVSSKPVPYSVKGLLDHASKKQQDMIDLIIDAGELPKNRPSTVVDTTLNNLNIMREGEISFAQATEDAQSIFEVETVSAEETQHFGSVVMQKFLDAISSRPLIFALKGELGAGKTQMVKGMAVKLNIIEELSSPTFSIIDEYDYAFGDHTHGKFVHMDTWRVADERELERTGIDRYLLPGNVIAIEWADKFHKQLLKLGSKADAKIIMIQIEYTDQFSREIKVYET